MNERVRINWPDNALLHGALGTVVDRPNPDEVLVRLDRITPAMMEYDDARTGMITVSPQHIEAQ